MSDFYPPAAIFRLQSTAIISHFLQLSLFQYLTPRKPVKETPVVKQLREILNSRVPDAALEEVIAVMVEYPVSLLVSRDRTSKLGDYRPARKDRAPVISVNNSLNCYAFLITLIHEVAHHHVQVDYSRSSQKFSLRRKKTPLPHGDEWKEKFRELMKPFLNREVFPPDLYPVVVDYFENPKASSSADHDLAFALKKHDPPDSTTRLEEIPFDSVFTLHGKRFFRKKERLRSRFRCICMKTNRIYLVSANAPVIRMESGREYPA